MCKQTYIVFFFFILKDVLNYVLLMYTIFERLDAILCIPCTQFVSM